MTEKQKKVSKGVPANESKADRFIRVVTPRIQKAIKAISVVGYCTSSAYEYKSEQVKQIVDVLTNAVIAVDERFKSKKSAGIDFKFK